MTQVAAKGTAAFVSISLMLVKTSVSVKVQVSSALVDIGEQRSPKKAPPKIAPPRYTGLMPITLPMLMVITSMVAAVPKEVPVSRDNRQLSKKVMTKKAPGWIKPPAV